MRRHPPGVFLCDACRTRRSGQADINPDRLAEQYQIKPEQMAKQLRDRNGFGEIQEQIISAKVLDFLELHAKIEEVLPGSNP